MEVFNNGQWLPLVFAFLMGLAMLIYVILDGYDLGVGILMSQASDKENDEMISSIGPFWDANETWLVLGVGILLVAFPKAHGIILTSLYMPVAFMLLGLIIRGVSFDFRTKAKIDHKHFWNKMFIFGSFLASMAQGFMLGMYIVGFNYNIFTIMFSLMIGICLVVGYSFVGASWLIMKTEHELQLKSVRWAKFSLWFVATGMVIVSISTPLLNKRIFDKWFSFPNFLYLVPIPFITAITILFLQSILKKLPKENDKHCWVPFIGSVILFLFGFIGLAYSFYPYIVQDQLTIWEAASSPESLKVILIGVLFVLPFIIAYTIYSYRVFWGKTRELTYY